MYCTSTQSREGQKGFGQAVLYSYHCSGKRADAYKGMNAAAPVGFKNHGNAIRAIVCDENNEWEPLKCAERTVACGDFVVIDAHIYVYTQTWANKQNLW